MTNAATVLMWWRAEACVVISAATEFVPTVVPIGLAEGDGEGFLEVVEEGLVGFVDVLGFEGFFGGSVEEGVGEGFFI